MTILALTTSSIATEDGLFLINGGAKMNINRTLFNETGTSLNKYYVHSSDIEDLLLHSDLENANIRQEKAYGIIEKAMSERGKPDLFKGLVDLAKVERGIRELQPYQRDHVVHSVLTFILGVYMIEKVSKMNKIDPFAWSLASFFHDVAYPVEISQRLITEYTKVINQCPSHTSCRKVRLDPGDFLNINSNRKSLDLINERINEWDICLNVKKIYLDMVKNGDACHGVYSAIFLLSMLDDIYQELNPQREYKCIMAQGRDWDETYFVEDIVSACSAIFLHNLNKDILKDESIDLCKAPLAYLLKLCDVLQDWDRPDGLPNDEQQTVFSACQYDLKHSNGTLEFTLPSSRKEKVEEELACLKGMEIILR